MHMYVIYVYVDKGFNSKITATFQLLYVTFILWNSIVFGSMFWSYAKH